jgi:hypothetical protein
LEVLFINRNWAPPEKYVMKNIKSDVIEYVMVDSGIEVDCKACFEEEDLMELIENKRRMIFISHSSEDKAYVEAFVELLEDIRVPEDKIVCSSVSPYCIPLGEKVFEWLVDKFQNRELHVIYMLSHNYYKSVVCLNEMGAAWAMKHKWSEVLLPGFGFDDISGCIDKTQIGIKLDDSDIRTLKYRLGELKDDLIKEFGLQELSPSGWERKRDKFLERVFNLSEKRLNDV